MRRKIMKMKIENNKFFVLETKDEKWIFNKENEAIKSMKEITSENKELKPEDISILEVDVKEKKWEIKEIPWARIALQLIRGE